MGMIRYKCDIVIVLDSPLNEEIQNVKEVFLHKLKRANVTIWRNLFTSIDLCCSSCWYIHYSLSGDKANVIDYNHLSKQIAKMAVTIESNAIGWVEITFAYEATREIFKYSHDMHLFTYTKGVI